MKTRLHNIDPLKPHFYIVKLGFTGVYIIFHILLKNIDCGYSLDSPRRGGSNQYSQSMFWAEIWKISDFLSENFPFFGCKISIYLKRCVFVMSTLIVLYRQHTKTSMLLLLLLLLLLLSCCTNGSKNSSALYQVFPIVPSSPSSRPCSFPFFLNTVLLWP